MKYGLQLILKENLLTVLETRGSVVAVVACQDPHERGPADCIHVMPVATTVWIVVRAPFHYKVKLSQFRGFLLLHRMYPTHFYKHCTVAPKTGIGEMLLLIYGFVYFFFSYIIVVFGGQILDVRSPKKS